MSYDGWSNYETWLVNLWLSNDQDLDRRYQQCQSADAIKDLVDDLVYSGDYGPEPAGFIADLIGSALSDVNWRELYENIEHDDDDDGEGSD